MIVFVFDAPAVPVGPCGAGCEVDGGQRPGFLEDVPRIHADGYLDAADAVTAELTFAYRFDGIGDDEGVDVHLGLYGERVIPDPRHAVREHYVLQGGGELFAFRPRGVFGTFPGLRPITDTSVSVGLFGDGQGVAGLVVLPMHPVDVPGGCAVHRICGGIAGLSGHGRSREHDGHDRCESEQ